MITTAVLDATRRGTAIAELERRRFDVLVIGGGITGCGVAREAAMRGLEVAMVEARDIAAATSSRSAKLIHGGSRYLAQGQVGVVREAAVERRTLRQIAPHLSLNNPMVVLAGSRHSLRLLRAGLWAYEKLAGVSRDKRHVVWKPRRLRSKEPCVEIEGVAGAAVYPEYLTDDARLTLANARSAAGHGAVVTTYTPVERIVLEDGRAAGVMARDAMADGSDPFQVRARVLVNAAGPWVDVVRRMEDPAATRKLQLTKGIHLVFSRDRLPISRTICWTVGDGRGVYAVPRGRTVYVGTTDTFFPEPKYWPEITRGDVEYLMAACARAFAGEPLTDRDVLGLWSGVRPLLAEEGKKPSEISRRHEILDGPGGVVTVAGGKLTSFRSMAERVVDRCEERLGRRPAPSRTADEPLPGGDFSCSFEELRARMETLGAGAVEAERAAMLYGSEAVEVFQGGSGAAVEAEFAVRVEGALTLEDYWVRRSARAHFDEDGGLAALEPAAERMALLLGWTDEEGDRQVEQCRRRGQTEMGLPASGTSPAATQGEDGR
jgi:glycerol-3-phosphate dehydrogenase